jgi:FkbM family methyltransferase
MEMPRVLDSLLRPHYVYRPQQIIRRICREATSGWSRKQTLTLPWGHPLTVNIEEHIGRAVWLYGLYGLLTSEVLWRLTPPGAHAVDVGANIGQMTSLLSHRAGPSGHVTTIVPHPEVFAALQRNLRQFRRAPGSAPIDAHQVALSESRSTETLMLPAGFVSNWGVAHLSSSRGRNVSDGDGISVACYPLADLVSSDAHIDVLKVDVEGQETSVLRGARVLLEDQRVKHVVYEWLDDSPRAIPDLLPTSYTAFRLGWTLSGPQLLPLHAAPSRPLGSPEYVATCAPDALHDRLAPRGWLCLSSGKCARLMGRIVEFIETFEGIPSASKSF